MVFSSLIFIYIFLPCVLLLYFLAPGIKIKNFILLISSLFFYAWGEPIWICLLLISGTIDFVNGKLIGRYRGTIWSKVALISSIVINLSLLGIFKYNNFFISNVNYLINTNIPLLKLTLPIGISFYTFQTLSYTIDVYRDRVKVQDSYLDFQLYVALFPQLIAGPIVRYADIEIQLKRRKTTLDGFCYGCTRFLCGLAKKVLIANTVGKVATQILGTSAGDLTVLEGWIGLLMFTFQIYFDFSGYSDMAIGLGKIFGFDYNENFNYPYISKSITDFWRRWHISLGSFFRDYVYIPLGGNRRKVFRNIFVVWFLTGFWHGASWNFILWGLYFGVLLVIEKYCLKNIREKIPNIILWFVTFILIMFGWAIFYFVDFDQLFNFIKLILGLGSQKLYTSETLQLLKGKSIVIIITTLCCLPIWRNTVIKMSLSEKKYMKVILGVGNVLFNIIVIVLCTASLVGASFNPFLYFRF